MSKRLRSPDLLFTIGAAVAAALGVGVAGFLATGAEAQIAVRNQGYVPFSDAPIFYRTRPLTDPVALLQKDLDTGKAKLRYDKDHGYLKSVLELLKVPVSSQTLVFTKTSFQYTKISPEHPRALYYNDDVYVGSVHTGKAVEVISFDPMQGAVFYLLDENETGQPRFERAELDCTQCHINASTRNVPGVMLRSVYATPIGGLTPRAPTYVTDQKSPIKERWGGWYVSGELAARTMANSVVKAANVNAGAGSVSATPDTTLSPIEKPFAADAYLTPTSDAAALLVLGHQTQMHNLITLTNYQTRIALHGLGKDEASAPPLASLPQAAQDQITKPAELLLRYLLFAGEAPLGGFDGKKVIAASAFARQFAAEGPRDSKKRSLRDFDLSDRVFRYPCSYLIYSAAFDALPEPAKGYIYHRLFEVLTGADQGADFAGLSPGDRQSILSILIETKPGLPTEWRDYARKNRLRTAALTPPRAGAAPLRQ